MINDKELRSAAKELVSVLGLVDENKEDIVITKTTTPNALKKIINDVINAKLIAPTDELSDETQEVVIAMTPKKGKKAKDEDEEETPKQTAERLHKENIANAKINTVKGMDDEDEDEDEDEKVPAKKTPGKKTVPKTTNKVVYSRVDSICDAVKTKKAKTIEALVKMADDLYAKHGGRENIKESKSISKYVLPALAHFDVVIPKE